MLPRSNIVRLWGQCMKNLPANKHNVRNWPFTVKSSCVCVRYVSVPTGSSIGIELVYSNEVDLATSFKYKVY